MNPNQLPTYTIKYVMKLDNQWVFNSGLVDLQEEMLESAVKAKAEEGFPEAMEAINRIKGWSRR